MSIYTLGHIIAMVDAIEKNIKQRRWLKKLKASGDPEQLLEAARIYDGKKKYREAFDCYRQSASKGNKEAQYELALCYDMPKGCEQDLSKAFQLCLDSAKNGVIEAMERVGMYYENGIGTVKDTESALLWYREAAKNGNRLAIRRLKNFEK